MTDLHGRPLSYNAVGHKAELGDESSFESRCRNKQGVVVTMNDLEKLAILAKIPEDILQAFPV